MQTKFFVTTYNIFSIKRVAKKFHVVTTMTKKCRKKGAKLLWFFFLPLSLPTPFSITRFTPGGPSSVHKLLRVSILFAYYERFKDFV